MSATDDAFSKATDNLDDSLQPVGEQPETKEDPKDLHPEDPDKQDPETPAEGKDGKDNEEGFTADQLEAEATDADAKDQPASAKVETPEINTDGLNDETKYIVDNLPYITARIKDGDGVKEVQVKSPTQLPENFEFASKRDELLFINAQNAQENRALVLQSKFQQDQQNTQTQQFEERENAMIREDVAQLQKEGELARFKTKMDDPKFDEDPTTQEVQKVMDFMENRNQQYLAEYNQGRPFRHIGFREAFYMYQRTEAPKTAQAQEDKERKELANRLTGNQGLTSTEMKKATVRSGTRIEDILNRIEQEW